jgi:hypothetical protein
MARTITITLDSPAAEEQFDVARKAFNTIIIDMINELDYTTKYQDEVLTALANSLYSGTFIELDAETLAAAHEYDSDNEDG